MSKSIKDYREAMDNVKISDSFCKRTETLLTELSEIKIDKKPAFTPMKVTAFISAAAACVMAVFGVKFMVGRNREVSEITSEITEITSVTDVTETASPIVDSIEEDFEFDEMMPESAAEENGGASESRTPENSGAGVDAGHIAQTTKTESAVTVAGIEPQETAAAPTVSSKTGSDQASVTEQAETVPLLKDISYDHVTVEITPYFDMGTVKSGESAIKLKGTECKEIIEFISVLTENDVSRKVGNDSFTSLFSLRIADDNIGLTFYDIYVADADRIVITKHDSDAQQRATYEVSPSDYEALRHILFLKFGNEEDYELFSNLISGK